MLFFILDAQRLARASVFAVHGHNCICASMVILYTTFPGIALLRYNEEPKLQRHLTVTAMYRATMLTHWPNP